MGIERPNRRTVLKGLGATLGGLALTGTATAHGDGGSGRPWGTFAWANDTLYEMADTDTRALFDGDPPAFESNGNHNAHAPLWLVGSMADYSGSIPGDEHSPHPNPDGLDIDHVVPLGRDFNAQWHVHLVVRPSDLEDGINPNNLPHSDGQGNVLTSAATIEAAVDRGDRIEIPLFTPAGEPVVFTCPIRPH